MVVRGKIATAGKVVVTGAMVAATKEATKEVMKEATREAMKAVVTKVRLFFMLR